MPIGIDVHIPSITDNCSSTALKCRGGIVSRVPPPPPPPKKKKLPKPCHYSIMNKPVANFCTDIISLVPRPAFFTGRWKSEGPGISCMRMRLIRHKIICKILSMMNDVIIKMYVARAHSISSLASWIWLQTLSTSVKIN